MFLSPGERLPWGDNFEDNVVLFGAPFTKNTNTSKLTPGMPPSPPPRKGNDEDANEKNVTTLIWEKDSEKTQS